MSPKLVFMLLICVAARQTYAFWVYGNGPNGLETDVGVEDRAYVNDRDVESTDGLSDKNAAVVDTQLSSGANNWATPEENSLSGDSPVISSFESEEGMRKKKRNDDMTDDREYKAMERMKNEKLDNTEGDNTPLYEDLIRRRRSFIYNDDDDTGADLQNESDNSDFEDSIQVSVVRRDAERGQHKDKRNTLNVDGLIAKRSATSEIDKNDNKTKNATRGPRQLNSPLPVNSASDSQIQHDLDAANTLINKMKYSIDDDDDDDDENNSDEDTNEDDSVTGESKRAVDADKSQQLSRHHKENMNKRTGDIDVASRKILPNDNDDYDEEELTLFRKRDSNIDYDDDYDTDDNNIEAPVRHKRESGIDDGPYDDDDEDADDDNVLWKRDTSSDTGLYDDDDDADYDDENGVSSFRRKRETDLDEGPEDDDDEDNDEDDDEYTDDNDDNRRRKSLNDGLDYAEEFNHDDNGDVDKRSTARKKKDTNIDSESDEDDDDNEYDENEEVAIRRKRNTADGQSDTAKRAFVREKKSKDHGINTDEKVLPDKENAIVISDSDVKNRKARAVYAYTEVDRTPDAGTIEALHRKLKRLIEVMGSGASGRNAVKPVE